jgi:hypothetical protein
LKSTGLALGCGLWETDGMAKDYIPKVGDIVTAHGQHGTFKVIEVAEIGGNTKIQPFHIGKQETFGLVMPSIPRSVLKPFKEDASQAAARIEKLPNHKMLLLRRWLRHRWVNCTTTQITEQNRVASWPRPSTTKAAPPAGKPGNATYFGDGPIVLARAVFVRIALTMRCFPPVFFAFQ